MLRLGNTLTKMRRNFCRRQGAMTSSGRYHARKSNAADGKKDKQIRQRISKRNTREFIQVINYGVSLETSPGNPQRCYQPGAC